MIKQEKQLFAPGHRACPGCSASIVARMTLKATGHNVIVVSATGCLETFTSPMDLSCWETPWIHSLFENAPAIASGVQASLKAKGNPNNTKVVVIAGDGGTYDIGIGSLSGMFERQDDVVYICYDNEAYMNTGVQRSGATPYAASTTTTPVGEYSYGKVEQKKNMIQIVLAHGVSYVATASIAYPKDFEDKVKKALNTKGPSYIHVLSPCNIGWGFEPSLTVEVAKIAVETGLYPLYEYVNGELAGAKKITKVKPVEEFLKHQKRFKHLLHDTEKYEEQINNIRQIADSNIKEYKLV
jgi:pyruvate ferredoxin oxidoreductase beta subunit